jgi:arsenite methyltransferase
LPDALRHDAEMYAGCVSGAIQKDEYLDFIEKQGFQNITIQKEKPIVIPNDILSKYLSESEITEFNSGATGIFSITVFAAKPGAKQKINLSQLSASKTAQACAPGSGCC